MHVNVLASFSGCFETWRNGLVLLFAYAQNPPQFVEYWIFLWYMYMLFVSSCRLTWNASEQPE